MEETKKITGAISISKKFIENARKKIKNLNDLKKNIENNLSRNTSELIEIILADVLELEVSDIHIEPEEKSAKIRVRIDGILHDVLSFNLELYQNLISRIKLLSKLKLNISKRPQDGRFSILLDKNSIEIRTSFIPAENGETIVLRILNPKWVKEMEDLGLRKDIMETLNREIKKPNGMILSCGPTGSGKTTTLYAFLKKIANPKIKIITIEDPIEYHLKGISQTQVDESKNYDFANGLKAIVRQDPDVILVGEIRDSETAKIAIQASLTGHLVLTTIHTNDASGAIARLQALGEKVENIAPALNLVIGQRLVRKICPKCAQFRKPLAEDYEKLERELSEIPKKILKSKNLKDIKIAYPSKKGCKECGFIGYKGRTGIFEIFSVDDEIEKFILTSPSIIDLKEKALKKGMILMRQDGFIKVIEGITTIEEVERTTTQS